MHLRLLAPLAAGAAAASAVPVVAHAAPPAGSCSVDVSASVPAGIMQSGESVSFGVSLTPASGTAQTATITVAGPAASNSTSFTGLPPGGYTVSETPPSGWTTPAAQPVTLTASACSANPSFANTYVPARATFQTVTDPAGDEAGWGYTLVGPGTPVGGEQLVTTGAAPVAFSTALQEGFYTVAQRTLTGWDQTASSGCVITVDYPADAGRTFACRVTDTKEGHVTVAATHGGQAPAAADAFHFVLSGGPSSVLLTQVAVPANHGSLDFGLLQPGTYTLCEQAPPAGWSTTLVAQGGIPNASGDICLPFTLAPGETRAFSVDTRGPAATATPSPAAAQTPSGGVQGVSTNHGATSTRGGAASTPSATGGIAIPNTGVGLSGLAGIPLLLLGTGLVVAGRRRQRR